MSRRLSPLLPALALLGLLWLRFHQPPNTVDDAYTTFRYARNLVQGIGFVYNPGEHVLGTTTPAYAMLLALAALGSGFQDFPRLALVLNALLNAVAFALTCRLTTRLSGSRWAGLAAGILLGLEGRLLDFSTGGMESSLNVLVVLLTWVLVLERRDVWAAATAGLACLIRPDGVTLAAIVLGLFGLETLKATDVIGGRKFINANALRSGRWFRLLPWDAIRAFALVVVPWLIFATFYFGHPIPQSVLAKAELYRIAPFTALRAFLVQLRTVFSFTLPPMQEGQGLAQDLLQVLFPGALVILGLVMAQRHHARAWAIGAYILLFIAFYTLGNPFWIGWYEIPLMFLYHALILAGVSRVVMWSSSQIVKKAEGGRQSLSTLHSPLSSLLSLLSTLSLTLLLALPFLSRLNVLPWETARRPAWVLNAAFNKRREFDYRLLARMLRPAAVKGRLVAIPEIGAFGYDYGTPQSPGRLFDTSGLISPKTLDYYPIPPEIPITIYSVSRPMMLAQKFDWFVSFDHFIQDTIPLDDAEFLAHYRPTLGLTSHAAFGIQRLLAYRNPSLPIEVTLPPEATPAEAQFGDYVTLRGYWVLPTADNEFNEFVDVLLFWQGRDTPDTGASPIDRDLLVRVQLVGADGRIMYEILNQPGETLFPTPTWPPGFWLLDRYPLKRPSPDAGPYTVRVTVFTTDSDFALPATQAGVPLPEDTFTIPNLTLPTETLDFYQYP